MREQAEAADGSLIDLSGLRKYKEDAICSILLRFGNDEDVTWIV